MEWTIHAIMKNEDARPHQSLSRIIKAIRNKLPKHSPLKFRTGEPKIIKFEALSSMLLSKTTV